MKNLFFIAIKRILHRKFVNLLIVSMLACGVSILLLAMGLTNGFEKQLIEKIISFSPQVTVNSKKQPDIKNVNEEIVYSAKINQTNTLVINPFENASQGVIVRQASPETIRKILQNSKFIAGTYPQISQIIIGNKLAENLKIAPGNILQVLSENLQTESFVVSGIFTTGMLDQDSGIVLATDPEINSESTESYYGLWLKKPQNARIIAKEIKRINETAGVSNWQDDNKALEEAIKFQKLIIFLVLSLIIVFIAVSLSLTQIIHVFDNKKVLGLIAALGLNSHYVGFLYAIESSLLSLVGVICGIAGVFFVKFLLVKQFLPLPYELYGVERLNINLNFLDILAVSCFAVIINIISSIIPAILASKQSPSEVLREP